VGFATQQRVKECDEVSALLICENEAEVFLVVKDDIDERWRDTVVEVWCARGERSQSRCLELTEIIPEPGNVTAPCVSQLASLTSGPVTERVQRKTRSASRSRRNANVKQRVANIGAVIRRVMTTIATPTISIRAVEYLLTTRDLRFGWGKLFGID
jgi:hypothetical protein